MLVIDFDNEKKRKRKEIKKNNVICELFDKYVRVGDVSLENAPLWTINFQIYHCLKHYCWIERSWQHSITFSLKERKYLSNSPTMSAYFDLKTNSLNERMIKLHMKLWHQCWWVIFFSIQSIHKACFSSPNSKHIK